MVPLLEGTDVLGVFEIFSSRPYAFGERDTQTLEALSRRILKARESAVRGSLSAGTRSYRAAASAGFPVPFYEPIAPPVRDTRLPLAPPDLENIQLSLNEVEPNRSHRGVDLMTALLAVMVVAASVGLGSLIGWRSGVMAGLKGEKKPLRRPYCRRKM